MFESHMREQTRSKHRIYVLPMVSLILIIFHFPVSGAAADDVICSEQFWFNPIFGHHITRFLKFIPVFLIIPVIPPLYRVIRWPRSVSYRHLALHKINVSESVRHSFLLLDQYHIRKETSQTVIQLTFIEYRYTWF